MENKIIVRRRALLASLETVNYQIKHLKSFYSKEQRRCWYVHRRHLKAELAGLPSDKQIQAGCKRVNFSNSSKILPREIRKMS